MKKFESLVGLFGNKGIKNIKELDAITHEFFAGMIEEKPKKSRKI